MIAVQEDATIEIICLALMRAGWRARQDAANGKWRVYSPFGHAYGHNTICEHSAWVAALQEIVNHAE